jgi:hypothetical protein
VQRYCEVCGTSASEIAAFCSGCGGKLSSSAAVRPSSAGSIKTATETVLLDEQGIKVTNARFLVESQTYAMAGVTSVKTEVEYPSKTGPLITIGIGVLFFLNAMNSGQFGGLIAGGAVFAVGVMWLRSRKPEYLVLLTTASGEKRAYESKDGALVKKVVTAINDAIVHRG